MGDELEEGQDARGTWRRVGRRGRAVEEEGEEAQTEGIARFV